MLLCPILGNCWCSVVTLVTFRSNLKNCKTKRKKCIFLNFLNALLLILPFTEISLRPELSSPSRFRIQEGVPWPLQKFLCLILDRFRTPSKGHFHAKQKHRIHYMWSLNTFFLIVIVVDAFEKLTNLCFLCATFFVCLQHLFILFGEQN